MNESVCLSVCLCVYICYWLLYHPSHWFTPFLMWGFVLLHMISKCKTNPGFITITRQYGETWRRESGCGVKGWQLRLCCYLQATARWDPSVPWCDHDGCRSQPSTTTPASYTHTRRYMKMEAIQLYFYHHCRDSRQKEKKSQETKERTEQDARSDRLKKNSGEKRNRKSCHSNILNTAKQQLISTSTHRYDAYIMVEVTGHLPETLS